jgi:hypothetical protein
LRYCVKSIKERIRSYRRYVYEAGAVNRPDKGKTKVINDKVLENERYREFEISRSDRFSTARVILRIPASSDQKNLFQKPTCDSNTFLFPKMKKKQNL